MDLVAVQSEGSRGRGIGRYSEELSKSILAQTDDVSVALNKLYPEHREDIEMELLINNSNIKVKEYLLLDQTDIPFEAKSRVNKLNTFLIKKELLGRGDNDIIHFHSVFEGLGGKADIVSDFSNMSDVKKSITLYDLIPLIYKETYLSDDNVRKWYFNKIRLCFEADLLLAISEASKEDAINILGIPEDKVINISGAIDNNKFYKMSKKNIDEKGYILRKYNINKPFMMYTGGIDFRKNIESSIKAFSQIKKKHFENYQYVIVCKISEHEKEHFGNLLKELNISSKKVIFTGFVSDEELNYLYNMAKLFIFPSIYEGFGLPVLEAMTCGTIVIGSNVSSVPEIIGRDDLMFDPTSVSQISEKINYILDNQDFHSEIQTYLLDRSKEFSWDRSSKLAIEAFEKLQEKRIVSIQKINVAFFSPLPPKRSGISDYSAELLPFLAKYFNVDIYIDDYEVKDDYLINNYSIFSYRDFESKKNQYDEIIYQFGNSEFHEYMYDIALKNPGIIVLHDFFLSGLVQYIANKHQNPEFFFDNLVYSHNKLGSEYQKKIFSHEVDIEKTINDLPINKKIIDSAKTIIVHSEYAKNLFKKYYGDIYKVFKVNQLIKVPSLKQISLKEKFKQQLGFTENNILISAFGHITDTKQYDFILNSICQAGILNNSNVKLIFVGDFISKEYKEKINTIIEKYKVEKQVLVTGFVDDDNYRTFLIASDIGLNLRVNSRGETSRALLMNMAYGLPTIINDYASFSELPSDATCKVVINSEKDFIYKLKVLIEDNDYRKLISKNAYKYIIEEHHIDDICQEYYRVAFNDKCLQKEKNYIEEVADIIVENDLEELLDDEKYLTIAKIIKD